MKYKPLNMFITQTDELKKLIAEHPDYPIVVLCGNEVVCDDSWGYWYAPRLSFALSEIDKLVEAEMKKYDPYWRNVIAIYADV